MFLTDHEIRMAAQNWIKLTDAPNPNETSFAAGANYVIQKIHSSKNESVALKAWVVRRSAFSIQCGGLQRLFVHFTKPTFLYEKLTPDYIDSPFGEFSEKEGIFRKIGWHETEGKMWVGPLSVGNWIGYDNPLSKYIWSELCRHFLNEPFEKWDILEKEGKCKVEDFCIELPISILLNVPLNIPSKNNSEERDIDNKMCKS